MENRISFSDKLNYVRLLVSLVFLVASLFIESFVSVIMCILCAIISGFDIFQSAFHDALSLRFFSAPLILSICCIALFAIGSSAEGAALPLAWQIGMLFLGFAERKSMETAEEQLGFCSERDRIYLEDVFSRSELTSDNYRSITSIAEFYLKILIVFAVFFAVVSPMLFNFSYRESIRRAVAVIVVCNSFSILASSRILSCIGLSFCAEKGYIFKSAQNMSKLSQINCIAIEKNGVLTKNINGSVSYLTDLMETEQFIKFCVHLAHNSKQPFAQAILSSYNEDINESLITNFKEIDGVGVGADISGIHAVLASSDYYIKRGFSFPDYSKDGSKSYILTLNGKYIGNVLLEEVADDSLIELTSRLREVGVKRCALITSDDKNVAGELAFQYEFDYFYPDCTKDGFNRILTDIKKGSKGARILFLNSENALFESADCNVSVNHESEADLVYRDSVDGLSEILRKVKLIKKLEEENILITYSVKALLVIVALSGLGQSWFSVFIDLIAACATFLNAFRINR